MARSKKNHDDGHIDETWLIPYADLLTLLLALFIVLFASSEVDSKKLEQMQEAFSVAFNNDQGIIQEYQPQNSTDPQIENLNQTDMNLEELKVKLDTYIKENNLSMELKTKINNESLVITISDNALFNSGSATVKPKFREKLLAISDMLAGYPDYEVVVSGHTDNRPINNREFESNWELSSKRALNCMNILLENDQLNPYMFSAIGYGEYRPVATNTSVEGRAKNRRVEVSIKHPNIADETLSILEQEIK
ncbi:MAG: flagellar motor protein MotB [Firmicutes bacterium]|nr:flagellar motor protein MotB [Bacillota bacterium]